MAIIDSLIEMGFDRIMIERAISAVGENIQAVIAWIASNENPLDEEFSTNEPRPGCSRTVDTTENSANSAQHIRESGASSGVKSILCEDCGKIMRPEELEFHAVKTSHENYKETSEEVKIMTEEEKQEAVKKAESLIKQRRASQAEKKRLEEIEYERNRRKVGQEMASVRQKFEEQAMRLAIETRKKEKQEAHLDRLRVLQDIERDRKERQERSHMSTSGSEVPVASQQPLVVAPPPSQSDYTQCELQIRLSDGNILIQTFDADEDLATVWHFIQSHRTDGAGPFYIRTPYPRRVFQESDMSSTLRGLGLCPKSVILVAKMLPGEAAGDF